MGSFKKIYFILFLTLLVPGTTNAQTFNVKGNISTSAGPVKFAVITFVNNNDSTKRFSTVTDSSGNYQLEVIITNVNKKNNNLPTKFELMQNYPNPFSGVTTISYQLNVQSDVKIKIYNILGQEIKSESLRSQPGGSYGILWDGTNNFGRKVTPGIYFYQLIAGNQSQTKKMLFGFGGANQSGLNLSGITSGMNIQSSAGVLKKTSSLSSASGSYWVYIQNADSTTPLVDCAKFAVSLAQQDTTLNYNVHNFDLSLCYTNTDSVTGNWQVYLNNNTGTNLKGITNMPAYNWTNPVWSPDGKYIVLCLESSIAHLFLYDVYKDSLIGFLTSDTSGTIPIVWTSDSKKIIFMNSDGTIPVGTNIINVDGTNNQQLKYPVNYLYSDNYNTLYSIQSSTDNPLVYHSNLDGTVNELIVDLGQYVSTKNGGVSITDYDPNTNTLLLSFDDPSTALPNFIGEYNIAQRQLDTLVVSVTGWKYYRPKYSTDYSQVALKERYIGNDTNYSNVSRISLFANNTGAGTQDTGSTLVEFRDAKSFIDSSPFAYSTADKYLAFVKDVLEPGEWVAWNSYLYIVELSTKRLTYIGTGISPLWNPLLLH